MKLYDLFSNWKRIVGYILIAIGAGLKSLFPDIPDFNYDLYDVGHAIWIIGMALGGYGSIVGTIKNVTNNKQ